MFEEGKEDAYIEEEEEEGWEKMDSRISIEKNMIEEVATEED